MSRWALGTAVAVLLLVGFVYWGNVAAPLISDDLHLNRRVPLESLPHLWTPSGQYEVYRVFYRPLTCTVYWLFPNAALPQHVLQLCLYLMACALVYRLALAVLSSPGRATVATVLFAVHPSHVQPVVWSADVADTLLLLWGTGALVGALDWMRTRDKGAAAWCLACTVACLFSKETAVSLAPLMALMACLGLGSGCGGRGSGNKPERSWLWAGMPFVLYAVLRWVYSGVQNPSDLAVQDYLNPSHTDPLLCLQRFGQHLSTVMVAPDEMAWVTAALFAILFLAGIVCTDSAGRRRKLVLLAWLAISILPTIGGFDVRYAAWPSLPFILLMVDCVADVNLPLVTVPVAVAVVALWTGRAAAEADLWRQAALDFQHIGSLKRHVQYLALPYAVDGRWGLWTFQAYEFSDPMYIHWMCDSVCRYYYDGPPGMAPVDTGGGVPVLPGGRIRPTWASVLGTDANPQVLAGPAEGTPWQVVEQFYWRPIFTEPMPQLPHG